MHRIDTSTAAVSLPAPRAAGTPGYFTKGNPGGGQPATVVSYEFMNAVQEELMNIVLTASLAGDKANNTQVLTALRALFADVANAQTIGGIKTFSASPLVPTATSGDNTTKAASTAYVVSQILANFVGGNQSLTASGFQKMPGGLILQWTRKVDTNGSSAAGSQVNSSVALPLTFPTACLFAVANGADDNATGGQEASEHSYSVTAKTASTLTVRAQRLQGTQTGGEQFSFYAFALGY